IGESEFFNIGYEGQPGGLHAVVEVCYQVAVVQRSSRLRLDDATVGEQIDPALLHDESIEKVGFITQVLYKVHINTANAQKNEAPCDVQVVVALTRCSGSAVGVGYQYIG